MANPYKKPWTETVSNRRAGCIERVHVRFGKGWSGTYLQRQRTGRLLHTRIQLHYHARCGRKTSPWHAQSANGVEPATASPCTHQSIRGTTRIERTASRDLGGDHVLAVNALKCPFVGRVEIAPQRFLDSGVEAVECPEGVAMR